MGLVEIGESLMLSEIDIRVYSKELCRLPHPCGHLLHAALLDMIRDKDPVASENLHEDAQTKPFSLSTLWPRTKAKGDELLIPPNTECRFHVSTLGRKAFDAFSKPIFERVADHGSIRIGGNSFNFQSAQMDGKYGSVSSFQELIDGPEIRTAILRFTSPTTFRRRGNCVPLPDPLLVYNSLWLKWQAFSDIKVTESVFEEMMGSLVLAEMNGHTRIWKYPAFMLNGFVGLVRFELAKPVSKEARCLFGALSRLAGFSGVGYHATMGMGQCSFLELQESVNKNP